MNDHGKRGGGQAAVEKKVGAMNGEEGEELSYRSIHLKIA